MKKITFLFAITLSALITNAQWIPQNSGTENNLWSVFFTDVNNGYVGGSLGTILKTTDGGMNWSSQNSGTTHNLSPLFFTDVSTGIALGDSGTIFQTFDGGNIWTKQIIDTTYILSSVFFTSTDTGYIAGYYTGDGGVIHGIILKTIDGGENWVTFTQLSCYLKSICFASSEVGYAVGTTTTQPPFYIILKTNDVGESWNSSLLPSMGKTLRSVFFINTDVGYAVGWDVILKTIDGGLNWTSQSVGENLTSVYFTDLNTGYIAGYQTNPSTEGQIFKTEDGGINWNLFNAGTESIFSIFFPNIDTGYVVGETGTIQKTTNGGGEPVLINEKPQTIFLKINPNPFTTLTTIEYELTKPSTAQLTIYNYLGKQVELIEKQQAQGKQQITWNAEGLPAGVYFCVLKANEVVQTKKIIKL